MPMFDLKDAAGVMMELNALPQDLSAALHPPDGLRLDARRRESIAMSFIVNRPGQRARLRPRCARRSRGRQMRYTVHSYATDQPESERATLG